MTTNQIYECYTTVTPVQILPHYITAIITMVWEYPDGSCMIEVDDGNRTTTLQNPQMLLTPIS